MSAGTLPPSFWAADNNDNHFATAVDLLRYWFDDRTTLTDEALWMKIQDVNRYPFDPLRILAVDYRPWDQRYTYYSDRMGLIAHPRFKVMRHLLPWFWEFTVANQYWEMANYGYLRLEEVIQSAERRWLELPLNAKFLANLNVWRTAITLKSVTTRQLRLFN